MALLSIQEVNTELEFDDFMLRFANVVEHCPLCAAAIWCKRPFKNVEELHMVICDFLDSLPLLGRQGILRLYPDLAGRSARQGKLSVESSQEHKIAGLTNLTESEEQSMESRNNEYKSKFGFPFIICVRKNKKEAILRGLQNRLSNSPEEELIAGMAEVKKICLLRLLDILVDDSAMSNKL